MSSLIVYLGFFYIVIGTIFLLVPIIYLELGRPKDLIKAFLNLLIGFIILIKKNGINDTFFMIFFLITLVLILYLSELLFARWHQLTDNEKKKLRTFLEFKNNLSKTLEAINLGASNLTKPFNFFNYGSNNQKKTPKKWVRNDKNDNIKV